MSQAAKKFAILSILGGVLPAALTNAQSFGVAKEKVTLHRKLPPVVRLTGDTIKVVVPSQGVATDLAYDLQSLLETELLKDDARLRVEPNNADTVVTCIVTSYDHPRPVVTTRTVAGVTGKKQNQTFTRITGTLDVSFQAKTRTGRLLVASNLQAKYDQEFDSAGNSTSQGVTGALTGTWHRLKGGSGSSEAMSPPTDSELRSRLLLDVVQQIAEHIVTTNETIDVLLAKEKGAMEDGDKSAEGGLWERALETFETAPPASKSDDDAYRLYNIGVAYEALAYQAEDDKAAMKFLDQAAINYGKAIDAKPSEKYFIDPQKRIETAIAHYKELEEESRPKPAPVVASEAPSPSATPAKAAAPKGLTNSQVIAMIKSGMDDDTVVQAIHAAKAINFDLTPSGQQELASNGVSAPVVSAMKTRAARKPSAANAPRPMASK